VRCPPAVLILLALAAAACGPKEWSADGLRVARWHGDKTAAVSYTFDGGYRNNLEIAVPLLEEHGFRGSFFLVAGWTEDQTEKRSSLRDVGEWPLWTEVADRGHELGNHSMTHPDMRTVIERPKRWKEVGASARMIEERTGHRPLSFSYPQSLADEQAQELIDEIHPLTRGASSHFGGEGFTAADADGFVDEALANGGWMVALIHSVGEDRGWNPTDTDVLAEHLARTASRTNALWVDTYARVGRYAAERDAVTLRVTDRTEASVTFTLSLPAEMKPAWYDVPLTVAVTTPSGTRLVEAVPDGRPVTVSW